ncbi:MAG TPA: glycosyl hydrolase family 79 C-terminal domain-containing protein [Solirubrobacteraceae bacterium]|nr:glycosyl hydrolase family 79 C-terminal domain-containing protein [Solirubrobacteraceae bacterium]
MIGRFTAPGPRGRWRWAPAAATAAALIIALVLTTSGSAELFGAPEGGRAPRVRPRSLPPAPAHVTISDRTPTMAVPRSFLGFSTEYWALPPWASQMPLLERVISLVHVAGGGPMILRVGGDSADHSFWEPREPHLPRWAFTIEPAWLAQARQLVTHLGVRLILDLNLITDSPAQATLWAQAAQAALPHGSITALEVGNEPDIYSRHAWLTITAGRQYLGRPLPSALSAADYVRDFHAYARALGQVAPHVMLAGPALARPTAHAGWVGTLIAGARRSLGIVTVHRYPLSGCVHRASDIFPTVGRVLSPQISQGMAAALRPVIDAAHDAGLPVRMTELNSVNCGGRAGVSDTFATALWAPDALFGLLHAGIDSVNLHVRADTINAPFALNTGGLNARPLLYGLIFFARALGPQARLVMPVTRARPSLNLQAYGVRTGTNTLHVVLLDKGRRSVRVALHLPATADASVQRLTAPSAGSRSGVTLGGRWLSRDGQWRGAAIRQVVTRRGGVYSVELRQATAAMLTVRVAPGALGAPAASPAPSARPAREASSARPVREASSARAVRPARSAG